MKVYCIALTGEGNSGSFWEPTRAARDEGLKNEEGIPFTLEVPDDADHNEITRLVDEAEAMGTHVPEGEKS